MSSSAHKPNQYRKTRGSMRLPPRYEYSRAVQQYGSGPARAAPRADGLTPQRLSGLFRFRVRCELQAALLRGNGLIAAEVGL